MQSILRQLLISLQDKAGVSFATYRATYLLINKMYGKKSLNCFVGITNAVDDRYYLRSACSSAPLAVKEEFVRKLIRELETRKV